MNNSTAAADGRRRVGRGGESCRRRHPFQLAFHPEAREDRARLPPYRRAPLGVAVLKLVACPFAERARALGLAPHSRVDAQALGEALGRGVSLIVDDDAAARARGDEAECAPGAPDVVLILRP